MFSKQKNQNSSKFSQELWQDLNEQQSEKLTGGGIGTSPIVPLLQSNPSVTALVLLFANPFAA